MLCILIEVLSCAHAKGGKSLNDFKFGSFIGRFQSDGAASMAVKGLMCVKLVFALVQDKVDVRRQSVFSQC